MPDVRKMNSETLIRMVGDELYRHTDSTPFMKALDELLRRVPIMEELCEAVNTYMSEMLEHAERSADALDNYRAMKGEQHGNTK